MSGRRLEFSIRRLLLCIACFAVAFAQFRVGTFPFGVAIFLIAIGVAVATFFAEPTEGALAGMAVVFVLIVVTVAFAVLATVWPS